MDQAMGDLQAQLAAVKRLWDEERMARQQLEAEFEGLERPSWWSEGRERCTETTQ